MEDEFEENEISEKDVDSSLDQIEEKSSLS